MCLEDFLGRSEKKSLRRFEIFPHLAGMNPKSMSLDGTDRRQVSSNPRYRNDSEFWSSRFLQECEMQPLELCTQ